MTPKESKILLVDDSEDDVYITLEAFQEANIASQVLVARDGQAALDLLKSSPQYKNAANPLLILLDINMPRKNGFEVLHALKADRELRHIPVIMLTTSTREEDVVKSYSIGACSYIAKPNSVDELTHMAKHLSIYWSQIVRVPGQYHEG
ncbi:response regulator [Haliangium ochraceum]|uniref:Response regulator receiver protein n=1 Tax=Haliangium ochraceum (strain DSM 14365 / JCM 11303 / SMP-2) TaxID=502025 RepID=D0LUM1_HALO1|nr:response regulator [Haliangium ochraceum]ACY13911.1 response regulator receiver protein [Haliangium ochraceum DSM 14365]